MGLSPCRGWGGRLCGRGSPRGCPVSALAGLCGAINARQISGSREGKATGAQPGARRRPCTPARAAARVHEHVVPVPDLDRCADAGRRRRRSTGWGTRPPRARRSSGWLLHIEVTDPVGGGRLLVASRAIRSASPEGSHYVRVPIAIGRPNEDSPGPRGVEIRLCNALGSACPREMMHVSRQSAGGKR